MDANKHKRYEKNAEELTHHLVGSKGNLQGISRCAACLRLVLNDNEQANLKAMENEKLAEDALVANDQEQIGFGSELVNDMYKVIADYNNISGNCHIGREAL